MRTLALALSLSVLAGCASLAWREFDQRFGPADPTRHDTPTPPVAGAPSFRREVQPILERRCVVCHGCYDAPCQLKLGSWEGLARGLSKAAVYDAARLREAPPTRLFVDAELPSQWRALAFEPVLNERSATADNHLAASLLHQTLELKRANPLPATALLPDGLDVSLGRTHSCPKVEEFAGHATRNPQAGMPYGLPAISEREHSTIRRWLQAGAPVEPEAPLTATQQREVQAWEAFLNGASNAERLMSRYLYEHLFLGQLGFDADPQRRPFRLIRSTTPPGQPPVVVATRRPYDDPGVARVHYRLVPEREALLAKTHMPYRLSAERMANYRTWFLAPGQRVSALPGYAIESASNPFVTFRELPLDGRYRFLLDEAEFFVMNFIKGPVCRGQLALDVIDDRFWVFFVDPRNRPSAALGELLSRESDALRLPSERGSTSTGLLAWREYEPLERRFQQAKSRAVEQAVDSGTKIDLSLIWDGDGRNPNAALTVFRHFDSASVVKGLVGTPPKTAWVIDYPLFERIFYLLVAGFDVYGNAGHQLNSRLYMDFLRMEGEFAFLLLLPQSARRPTAEHWYRGAGDEVVEHLHGPGVEVDRPSSIAYRTRDPQRELYAMLGERLAPVLPRRFDLAGVADAGLRRELSVLAALRGAGLAWLPETTILRIGEPGKPAQVFTLLRDTAHRNVAHVVERAESLAPDENALTVVPGLVGAYPNAIFGLRPGELAAFTAAVGALGAEADYRRLADRFAVRRTDPRFWSVSDELHDWYAAWSPAEAALLDYGRLENR